MRIVRLRHWFTLALTMSGVSSGDLPLISRSRSNVTIVSLSE